MPPPRTSSLSGQRRGTIYVLVLALVMIMMAAGVAAISLDRARTRTISQGNDTLRAQTLAESAVEQALAYINSNSNWRNTYTSGHETAQIAFGGGKISFILTDECDGNLSGGDSDPVRIYGIGRAGKAVQVYSCLAVGTTTLTCLNVPLCVGGTLTCNKATINASGQTIAANGNVTGGSSVVVNGNVDAAGSISANGWTLNGTSNAAAAKRAMPGCTVFDSYTNGATTIPFTSLPLNGFSGRALELCVLSPTNNPYGSGLNANGVYVIDCAGANIVIRNCRIVGTLVILNPGSSSSLTPAQTDAVFWVPAVANYPCLMVKGSMILEIGAASTLSESSLLTNFNPPSTPYPYPDGASDLATGDDYPNQIAGLVYISGNVSGNNTAGYNSSIDMLVVGGACDLDRSPWNFVLHGDFAYTPPPGFTGSGTIYPIAGSWKREAAP